MTNYTELPLETAGQAYSLPTAADLPTVAIYGSIRYVEETEALYVFTPSGWKELATV